MAQVSRIGPRWAGWAAPDRQPRSLGLGRVRQTPPDMLVDVVLAAGALTGSLLLLSHGGFGSGGASSELDLPGGLLAVGATLPLLTWRRTPFGVFVAIAVVSTIAAARGYALGIPVGPAVALYLLATSRNDARPWTPHTAATVIASCAAFLAATAAAAGGVPVVDLVHNGLPWAIAWFAGERTRLRRAHIANLEEQAARVEHEALQDRLLAVADERARIARDLHDSAGHAINVIAVRAGTARLRYEHDLQRAHATLAAIEELARHTVGELDQLVGTLRANPPDGMSVEAPPGLASLDTLLAHHTGAGLPVTVTRTGTPRQLGAAIDQAAYRILQEALTNAARHGTGPAHIELVFADTALELIITNPAHLPAARPPGGHGLIGMHERAVLLGGVLHTSHENDEFRVHARLPHPATHK